MACYWCEAAAEREGFTDVDEFCGGVSCDCECHEPYVCEDCGEHYCGCA